MEWQLPALVALVGYLLGSIPFGIILTRLAGAGEGIEVRPGDAVLLTNPLRFEPSALDVPANGFDVQVQAFRNLA